MEGRTPILIDFGLARVADDPASPTPAGCWARRLPRARDPARRGRQRRLRRALLGRHRGVRRHRPGAVRPWPLDGDHGPGPARRARPHRAARRAARPGGVRARPRPRPASLAGRGGHLAAPADHAAPARPAAGAHRGRAAGGPRSPCRSRSRPRSPPGPCARGPPTWCRPRWRSPTAPAAPSSRGTTRTGTTRRPSGGRARTGAPPVAGRPGPPAAARRRRTPARGRRADGAAVAVPAARGRRHVVAAQRLARGQRRGRAAPGARPPVVRRRAVPGGRALAPRARRPGLGAARAVERRAGRGGRPGLLRPGRRGHHVAPRVRARPRGSLLLGPGSSRVRSPLARVVDPVAASGRRWLVAVLLVLAAATATGYAVETNGTDWTPSDRAPWRGSRCPARRSDPDGSGRGVRRRPVAGPGPHAGAASSVVVTSIRAGRSPGPSGSHDAVRSRPSTRTEEMCAPVPLRTIRVAVPPRGRTVTSGKAGVVRPTSDVPGVSG